MFREACVFGFTFVLGSAFVENGAIDYFVVPTTPVGLSALNFGIGMSDEHILLIEDDPAFRALMLRAIEKAASGSRVHTRTDGEEAIAYFAAGASGSANPLPSVVITDLKMPRKTGLEVLSWIRSQPSLSAIPVYVLSSSNDPGDIDRAISLGARAFIEKPLGLSELVEVARSILAKKAKFQPK